MSIKAGKTISYAEAKVVTADSRLIAQGTSTRVWRVQLHRERGILWQRTAPVDGIRLDDLLHMNITINLTRS